MCGSCHDIQNMQGAHVERTFREWQSTLFAVTPGGAGCAQCHMAGRDGPASQVTTRVRRLHDHSFPAVDLPATPFPADAPQNEAQRTAAQALLDTVVQSTLCWNPLTSRFELTLDNVASGHAFPSGATPDRRAWVEVAAYAGGQTVYTSGDATALPLEGSPDPDLWLMRDCLYDAAGKEVKMFWEPTSTVGTPSRGRTVQNITDPCSFRVGHVKKVYPDPVASSPLAQMPERATVKIHLQAIGDDVLQDLVRAATSIRRCPRPSPATIWAAGPRSSGPGLPPRPTSIRSQAPRFRASPPGCGKAIRYRRSVMRAARRPRPIRSALSQAPDPPPRG